MVIPQVTTLDEVSALGCQHSVNPMFVIPLREILITLRLVLTVTMRQTLMLGAMTGGRTANSHVVR